MSPGKAGLSQGPAVPPASYQTEVAPAELPLCLYANFRHMFQIAAELHIISQHCNYPVSTRLLKCMPNPKTMLEA